jgi:hypothetical protein
MKSRATNYMVQALSSLGGGMGVGDMFETAMLLETPRTRQIGPGRKSILKLHERIAKGSKYMPHQGRQECARRLRQAEGV